MKRDEQKIWCLGDLHLGQVNMHNGQHSFIRRKPGYENRLFKAWDFSVRQSDVVVLLGNITTTKEKGKRMRPLRWFERIQEMPGHKILCMGSQERNRPWWYERFGFGVVVPFNEAITAPLPNKGPLPPGYIMFSHLPVYASVLTNDHDQTYKGLCYKLGRQYDRTSAMLNIHAHTLGRGMERHQTIDAGLDEVGEGPVTVDQLIARKYALGKEVQNRENTDCNGDST